MITDTDIKYSHSTGMPVAIGVKS